MKVYAIYARHIRTGEPELIIDLMQSLESVVMLVKRLRAVGLDGFVVEVNILAQQGLRGFSNTKSFFANEPFDGGFL